MASDGIIVWKLRYQNLNSRLYSAETAFRIFLARSNRDGDELIPLNLIDSLNRDVEQLSKKLALRIERLKIVCNALKWQLLLTQADGISNEECEKWSDDIKDAIHLFKIEGSLMMTDLLEQQTLLERQVSALRQTYNDWDWDKTPCGKQNSLKKLRPPFAQAQTKNLPLEVLDFQEFMSLTKKHQQEWSDAEHSRFLKLWKCKKLMQDFMTATQLELPSKFPKEILCHIEWYKNYLNKKERKVKALREWKDRRQKKQLDKMNESEQETKVNHLKLIQQRNDKILNMFAWKIDKEKATKKAKHEERKKARQKCLQQRKLQQKKAKRLRMIIHEYHEKKRKLNQELIESTRGSSLLETARPPRETTKHLAEYWKRDKMIVKQRQHKIEEKLKRSLPPKINAKNKGKRDPGRIFKLTKSSKAKITKKPTFKKDEGEASSVTSPREIPHRKVPSWLSCYNISKNLPAVLSSEF